MFTNYLKTTLRNLWNNKSNSFLNIFGLAIGIACAGLIFIWVENEKSYDKFHQKKDQLYFTRVNAKMDNGTLTHGSSPGVLAPAMKAEIPGIANTCRMSEGQTSLLFSIGDKSLYASGRYVEPSVFDMFTLPFVEGSARSAFAQLYSVVITQKTAVKFFGTDRQVVGKTIRVDNKQDYLVSGVLKDLPVNSTLNFEWLVPFQVWYQQSPWAYKWENNCLSTYVELKPGANLAAINKQLYGFVQKRAPQSNGRPFLFAMNDWRLYDKFENGIQTGGGRIEYVRLFTLIAWIILLIACINFMNLSTARSEKRAREVGVRKVLGAGKRNLVMQFLGEAFAMAILASMVAVVIMILVLPAFNLLVGQQLVLDITRPSHAGALLAIAATCGLVAGSYPALYLSSFNPVFVLKGLRVKTGGAAMIRKTLVVLQFSISTILIISTVIIYLQIQHVKNRDLGFAINNLVVVNAVGDITKKYTVIRHDLLNTGLVENVALSDHATIYGGNNTDDLQWQGKTPGAKVIVSFRNVSPEYIATSGMQISEGRDFYATDSIDGDNPPKNFNVLITQSMADMMGKGSAIGKSIQDASGALSAVVVGVVKDYVYGNMYGKPDPVLFICVPPRQENMLYLRIKSGAETEQAMTTITSVFKKNNPSFPFEYRFVDDQFQQIFVSEMLISRLSRLFAILAIIISCLGLFGLSAYMAERRTKEIGIRKVLGASVSGITGLLSRDFLQLVIISCLLAFPLSWWMMYNWLQNYSYRITIGWWVFLMSGLLALLIAFITISFQSVRAAAANPIRSLRSE